MFSISVQVYHPGAKLANKTTRMRRLKCSGTANISVADHRLEIRFTQVYYDLPPTSTSPTLYYQSASAVNSYFRPVLKRNSPDHSSTPTYLLGQALLLLSLQANMDALPTVTLDEVLGHATLQNLAYLIGGLAVLKVAQLSYNPVRQQFSPLRQLTGPKNESLIFGHMKRIFAASGWVIQEEWMGRYGATFAYRSFLSSYRLFTTDTRALAFIMTQSNSFPKPEMLRKGIANLLGEGILFAEFDTHKRQRRIMNPAFGPLQVRELVPIFWQKSNKLKEIWLNIIKANPEGETVIEVMSWLSRATLDIIGAAGFDYHFNSLDEGDEDELAKAFSKIFSEGQQMTVLGILKNFIPALSVIK
ncbi:hypothetical protein FRC12_014811 [Ceratobasidium sp. 428]|nr:hypothetical protein FRC12_014811 [Ceratobasidium sp. 428]